MANPGIQVPYNFELKALEKLLSTVQRPGDYFVAGSLEAPMPRIEVEGVGLMSFPVPEIQAGQLIQNALRAPYGRGEETIQPGRTVLRGLEGRRCRPGVGAAAGRRIGGLRDASGHRAYRGDGAGGATVRPVFAPPFALARV